MLAIIKLLNSYYMRGFFGPFFVVVFPILLMFILANAMESIAAQQPNPIAYMSNIVAGIMITSLISNGLFGLPVMIIEFKKSTLMKRVGAAHISKRLFLISILVYQFIWCFVSVFWTLLWGGIIIGTKANYDWSVAFNSHFGETIPFLFLTIFVSVAIGLIIVSFLNTQQGVMGVANVIYLPISFLSGSFLPKTQIDSSSVLSGISYVLPTKYAVDPFFAAFMNGFNGVSELGWASWGYPLIACVFVVAAVLIATRKFKWS